MVATYSLNDWLTELMIDNSFDFIFIDWLIFLLIDWLIAVTKLDAANHFTVSHLEDDDNWKLVEKAQVHRVNEE